MVSWLSGLSVSVVWFFGKKFLHGRRPKGARDLGGGKHPLLTVPQGEVNLRPRKAARGHPTYAASPMCEGVREERLNFERPGKFRHVLSLLAVKAFEFLGSFDFEVHGCRVIWGSGVC